MLSLEFSTHFEVSDLRSELLRDNFVEFVRRMKLNDFFGLAKAFLSCSITVDVFDCDERLLIDDIFGVELRMKELFDGKVAAICISFTGSVFDFSLAMLGFITAGESITFNCLLFDMSLIGVDDARFLGPVLL
jgi:hypothetical protein